MSRTVKIVTTILLLTGAAGLAFNAAPGLLIPPIAAWYLERAGIRLESLDGVDLGSGSLAAQHLRLSGRGWRAEAAGLQITFLLSELRSAQLRGIALERLQIELGSSGNDSMDDMDGMDDVNDMDDMTPGGNVSLPGLMRSLGALRLGSVDVADISLSAAGRQVDINLQGQTQPPRLTAVISSPAHPQTRARLSAELDDDSRLLGNLVVMQDNTTALESGFTLTAAEEDPRLEISGTVYTDFLGTLLAERLAPTLEILTSSLSLEASLVLSNPSGNPDPATLDLTVDSPDSRLLLSLVTESDRSELQLQLPLTAQGEINIPDNRLEITFAELKAGLTYASEANEANEANEATLDATLATTLVQPTLRCTGLEDCVFHATLTSHSPGTGAGGFRVDDLSLSGDILAEYNERFTGIRAPRLNLSASRWQSPFAGGELDLTLTDLTLMPGTPLRGGLAYHSTGMSLATEDFSLSNPTISGTIDFLDEQLTASLSLNLDNRLQAGASFNHHLGANSGQAYIDVTPVRFSPLAPLSALLRQERVNLDLAGGDVSASAVIAWQRDPRDRWQSGGTMALELNGISGYLDEIYFIDLNTSLDAELDSGFALRSAGMMDASIATIDIGLPLENSQWSYGFDSAAGEFHLAELTSELLGGSLTVPAFSFSTEREENGMTVVLSRLDLRSIAGLADYPDLYVDGFISGYLPLAFKGGQVLIDQGLAGALNPGGSIRYTPGTAVPGADPNVQLVNEALSNYQYRTLDTEVYYDESGDLYLAIRLRGANPDLNGGQPINLNVNITNNIPALLRSLQAARAITDELEAHLDTQR